MDKTKTEKKVQLDDIAAVLGLSKSTVSRAISGKGRVSAATRERVYRCMEELHYQPPSPATGEGRKQRNIGIAIPIDSRDDEAPFFHECLIGVSKECAVRDYDTIVVGIEKNDTARLRSLIEKHKTDGMIITRPLADKRIEKLLKEEGVPFVVIGKSMLEDAVTVDSDHYEGCRQLTLYLMMSNPKDRIAILLGNMNHTVNRSRFEGYKRAFTISGGKNPPEDMVYTGADSPINFVKALKGMMKHKPRCVICGDDMLCMKLITELHRLGKSVPEDVRVASLYDSVYLDNSIPPVTSLVFDAGKLGSAAASVLIDMIDPMAHAPVPHATMLSFEMLIRGSTM